MDSDLQNKAIIALEAFSNLINPEEWSFRNWFTEVTETLKVALNLMGALGLLLFLLLYHLFMQVGKIFKRNMSRGKFVFLMSKNKVFLFLMGLRESTLWNSRHEMRWL